MPLQCNGIDPARATDCLASDMLPGANRCWSEGVWLTKSCIGCMIQSVDDASVEFPVVGSAFRLVPSGVGLLAPEDAVWRGMLTGWERQQLARMLKASTVRSRVMVLERFQLFCGDVPLAVDV